MTTHFIKAFEAAILITLAGICLTSTVAKAKTRYPIVLAHGLLSSDSLFSLQRAGLALARDGHDVFLLEVTAAASIETRASQLKRQVMSIIARHHLERVNIIAHSMGGLDARLAISGMGLAPHVASLTTLSTPHRGSPVADESFRDLQRRRVFPRLIEWFTMLFNDHSTWRNSDLRQAVYNLTTWYTRQFNERVLDDARVSYQSWGAYVPQTHTRSLVRPILREGHRTVFASEGSNDGLVSLQSARWGEDRGYVLADHLAIVGIGRAHWRSKFDYGTFFQEIGRELEDNEY